MSQAEFSQAIEDKCLRLTLIGMSNIGKSYTAMRIARAFDFKLHEIDTLIAKEIGKSSLSEMAEWMGFPYEPNHAFNASRYLDLEKKHTLQATKHSGNVVIDTTGSVIHIDNKSLKTIINNSLVIYIAANEQNLDLLRKQYYKTPKPTIWHGGAYKKILGKSEKQSLLHSYRGLLENREKLYKDMADISLTSEQLRAPTLRDKQILSLIQSKLPS
ncbi:MAG: shikimate kinase [Robiginitomaculum sp.]